MEEQLKTYMLELEKSLVWDNGVARKAILREAERAFKAGYKDGYADGNQEGYDDGYDQATEEWA